MTYGTPEELSSDGGTIFTSAEYQTFLRSWGVTHRLSSAAYPQSNRRAELAVKSAKRLIQENTNGNGSLDNDKAARAILQYRNTPMEGIGLSPAQLLLHRELRDSVPTHPSLYKPSSEWISAALLREKALTRRNTKLSERYNTSAYLLPQLAVTDIVAIQNMRSKRWNCTGRVVEVLPNRQYRILFDGSGRVVLRNRRFIRQIQDPRKQ